MPRSRLATAELLRLVEPFSLGATNSAISVNAESTRSDISPKTRRRYRPRKKECTKGKLVLLSAADEARMRALAEHWGTTGSGAIKRALREAAYLNDVAGEREK